LAASSVKSPAERCPLSEISSSGADPAVLSGQDSGAYFLTKRIRVLARCRDVRLMKSACGGWVARMGAVASGVITWRVALLVFAVLAADVALRLLTEWQRRRTFASLLAKAPVGTVIVQQDGPEGETMTVTWGGSAKSAAQPPSDRS